MVLFGWARRTPSPLRNLDCSRHEKSDKKNSFILFVKLFVIWVYQIFKKKITNFQNEKKKTFWGLKLFFMCKINLFSKILEKLKAKYTIKYKREWQSCIIVIKYVNTNISIQITKSQELNWNLNILIIWTERIAIQRIPAETRFGELVLSGHKSTLFH